MTALRRIKKGSQLSFPLEFWSGRRVSNSRPQPWQGCALPTELLPHGVFTTTTSHRTCRLNSWSGRRVSNSRPQPWQGCALPTELLPLGVLLLVLQTTPLPYATSSKRWSGRRVSNSRPQPWQGCALPTELLPQRNNILSESLLHFQYYFTTLADLPSLTQLRQTVAGEESRTLDLNLGKVALYQLSYSRVINNRPAL